MAQLIEEHTNLKGETISIKRLESGVLEGEFILGIGTQAPILLDIATMDWLSNMIEGIRQGALPE